MLLITHVGFRPSYGLNPNHARTDPLVKMELSSQPAIKNNHIRKNLYAIVS